jgi:IS30 family transposase
MNQYKRLTQEDRVIIAVMRNLKTNQYRIAEEVKVTQSAISQELSRNLRFGVYDANESHRKTLLRKGRKKKVLDDVNIREFVLEKLKQRRSPQQISVMAEKEKGYSISKSTIYEYLQVNKSLRKYLKHRKYRRKREISSKHGIKDRVSIKERPIEAETRTEYGHYEMDFIVSRESRECILTFRDRMTRYPVIMKMANKEAFNTLGNLRDVANLLRIKTLSTDNDKSFAFHKVLEGITETKTYFTRPAAPYEKGSIENLNKEIRVFYPKKTDFSKVTQEDLERVAVILRNTPMKVLGWKTPQEAFTEVFNSS